MIRRLDDLQWRDRRWDGVQAYSDSKLLDLVLAFAVARRWPEVRSNALSRRGGCRPGWAGQEPPTTWRSAVTRRPGWRSQHEPAAQVTGRYLYHRTERPADPSASDPALQDALLAACAQLTGVEL